MATQMGSKILVYTQHQVYLKDYWRSNEEFPAEFMKGLLLKGFSITSVETHYLVHTQKKKTW